MKITFSDLTKTVLALIDKAELTPSERASLAGDVKSKLKVPGVIWSPEDYEDSIRDELEDAGAGDTITDALVAELSDQAFNVDDMNPDLHDDDWDRVRSIASDVVAEWQGV